MNNEEKRQFYMDHIYSHRKDMYRILWSMFGDPDIVEEIAQGVLDSTINSTAVTVEILLSKPSYPWLFFLPKSCSAPPPMDPDSPALLLD